MNRPQRVVGAIVATTVGVGAAWLGAGPASLAPRDQPAGQPGQPSGQPTDPAVQRPAQGPGGFPGLAESLRESPGCLGIESARTGSGKNVLFAWFKDKASVVEWYESPKHQGPARRFFGPADSSFKPLADVSDDAGPLMVIASITFSDKPHFKETDLAISQISIEIYQPVTGGIFLGGRFAPEGMKVKGMREYTAPPAAADGAK
jgi:hypothetical protein